MIVTLISLGDRARWTEPGRAKLERLTYAVPTWGGRRVTQGLPCARAGSW
jgi:hypothetical protein